MIAALFVETNGCYFGLPDVEPWDINKNAKNYNGPWKVIAHPPCQRWGRFYHGSPRNPHQFKLGDDGDCFLVALNRVRKFGGILEHPADSHAWDWFHLNKPPRYKGWVNADHLGGKTCYVEQGHYGHFSRKPTWLYGVNIDFRELNWSKGEQRIHPVLLERHGYEKARRQGMCGMIGGKDKVKVRERTPTEFRDLLISMVR